MVKGGGSFATPSPGPTGLSLGSTPCLSLLLGESVKPSPLPGTQEASGLASITAETPPLSPIPHHPASAGPPGDQRGELTTRKGLITLVGCIHLLPPPAGLPRPGPALAKQGISINPPGPLRVPEPQSRNSPLSKRNEIHFFICSLKKSKSACLIF